MRLLSLPILFALVGCSVENSSSVVSNETTQAGPGDSLIGQYAMTIKIKSTAKPLKPNPLVPDASGESYIYRLAEIVKSEEGYAIKEKNCAVAGDPKAAVKFSLDAKTVQLAPEMVNPLVIEEVEGGLKITRGKAGQALGLKMENPLTDEMPVDGSDASLIDNLDGDKNPGITGHAFVNVLLKGDLYFGQRSVNEFSAIGSAEQGLTGELSDVTEQIVFGTNVLLLKSVLKNFRTISVSEAGSVNLQKLDEGSDCSDALAKLKVK